MARLGLYGLIAIDLALIALYMHARTRDDKPRVKIYQPAAVIVSWLIAAASLLRSDADVALVLVVLLGMGIAIIGDFLNIDMQDMRVVIRGLVIAVAAYMTYAIGLTVLDGFHGGDVIVGILLLAVYAQLMRTLWPGMEPSMRIPSLIYGLVLPLTFSRAVSTFFGTRFELQQSIFLSLGTFSLFVGDVEFAVHTFKRRLPLMLGPILYAGGQLLIALSTWA
jgi:hypothetical protein